MAWIRIDEHARHQPDMKTVLGNKMSGCGSDALGLALYVNEWEKDDGKLWLEWGDGANGCHKVKAAFAGSCDWFGEIAPQRDWDGQNEGFGSSWKDNHASRVMWPFDRLTFSCPLAWNCVWRPGSHPLVDQLHHAFRLRSAMTSCGVLRALAWTCETC